MVQVDKFGYQVGVADHLIQDVKDAQLVIQRPHGRQLVLFENLNDGHLEYCLAGINQGPAWKRVDKKTFRPLMTRERLKLDFANDWLGKFAGRPIVLFGTGPQLKRVTAEQIKYIKDKGAVIAGVNAMPAVCRRMWNLDPEKTFDFIMAADAVFEGVRPLWGWDHLGKVTRFLKGKYFDEITFPIYCDSAPGLNPVTTGGRDSITHAINMALCAQATEISPLRPKGGPNRDWPIRYMKRADGARIILVGVEANNYCHAYTDRADFFLPDRPELAWPDLGTKIHCHEMYAGFAKEIGAQILNAAPWSAVTAHLSCDFEEELDIPDALRTGVSSKGIPKIGPQAYDPDKLDRYQRACITAGHNDLRPPDPPALQRKG